MPDHSDRKRSRWKVPHASAHLAWLRNLGHALCRGGPLGPPAVGQERRRAPRGRACPAGRARRAPGALLLLVALLFLFQPAMGQEPGQFGPWLNFEGNLSATGTSQVLAMGPGRNAGIVYLSGSLVMTSQEGLSRGFLCRVVTYQNGAGGGVGSCVWTDDRGDQIFSEIEGESLGKGKHIHGVITGGTGRYAGLTGEYDLVWQYVVQESEGVIQGRAVGMKGRVHRAAPGAPSPPPKEARP